MSEAEAVRGTPGAYGPGAHVQSPAWSSPMPERHGYPYYSQSDPRTVRRPEETEQALEYSRSRLFPSRGNPSYPLLEMRRTLFQRWLESIPGDELHVLDVGGRVQPYRPLVEDRARRYVGFDPQLRGLVDVVGTADELPFASDSFDLLICTQVLHYTEDPARAVGEMHRVLAPGATLFLTVPALFPEFHDHRWRFMPEGIEILLRPFAEVEIVPEGYSVLGFFRTVNIALDVGTKRSLPRRVVRRAVIPALNACGEKLDGLSRGNQQFTANYSVRAEKGH